MRTIISLVIASMLVANSSLAMAEAVSTETGKPAASASPETPKSPAEAVKPATQESTAVAPAESGLDQQLCVQK